MAKIESEIVIKVTADSSEIKQSIAEAVEAAFRDGWETANTEIQDSQLDCHWQNSETKKKLEAFLKS